MILELIFNTGGFSYFFEIGYNESLMNCFRVLLFIHIGWIRPKRTLSSYRAYGLE